jgi:Tol biopolymer transport system component
VRARDWPTLLGAALVVGCSGNYTNPFVGDQRAVAPRADAAIVFTSNGYRTQGGGPRELFAADAAGGGLTRLTFCNVDPRRCDTIEAAPAPDRQRMAIRRVLEDTNKDGRLTAADAQAMLLADLSRSVEGTLLDSGWHVSGVDWSPAGSLLLYSGTGACPANGGTCQPDPSRIDDLFLMDTTLGADGKPHITQLTASEAVAERRPRFDPSGTRAVYERSDANARGQVVIYNTQTALSAGAGADAEALAGTPYFVGSDADPAYSPDGRVIVFRRLTATGNGGLGTWDILSVRIDPFRPDGSGLTRVATGPVFRGAPDWAAQGIVFNEIDVAAGTSRLMLVSPDGTTTRALVTMGAGFEISFPRWLR